MTDSRTRRQAGSISECEQNDTRASFCKKPPGKHRSGQANLTETSAAIRCEVRTTQRFGHSKDLSLWPGELREAQE
jgi:hypothetical protein